MCFCYLGQSKRMYILTGVETRWKVPGIISDSFQHVNNNNNKMQVTYLFIHPLGRPCSWEEYTPRTCILRLPCEFLFLRPARVT